MSLTRHAPYRWAALLSGLWLCSAAHAAPASTRNPEDGLEPDDAALQDEDPSIDGPRRLAIGEIHAPAESNARGAVLEALSARTEVEVVGYEDVKMAGKQLGVSPATARGRTRITEELGVFAWVEGEVSAQHEAALRLVDGDGRTLATMRVQADSGAELDTAIGKNLWSALGRFVSEAAARQHLLQQQHELAEQKQSERRDELEHQKELALERETTRTQLLNDERTLARRKQEARFEELQRQVQVVLTRREEEARAARLAADQAAREERELLAAQQHQDAEAERLADAQRRQEEARLLAAQRQAQTHTWQPAAQAQPAPPPWRPAASGPQPTGRFPKYQGTTYEAPTHSASTPSYADSDSDYGAPVSAETQRWLEGRNSAR